MDRTSELKQETKSENAKLVSIILPCFNEEGNIVEIYEKIKTQIDTIGYDFELIFIDDGSTDQTLHTIKSLTRADNRVKCISFSRNFGHQAALKAGFDFCHGDCAITMDADLQHPPSLLAEMIENWENGFEIVFTLRKDESETRFFKRFTSNFFYKFMNYMSGLNLQKGAADFRLIDRKIIDIFKDQISEYHLFYRGLISWVGFKTKSIEYAPSARHTGKTKYTFMKMLNFALNGITSFSIKPLRLSIVIGFILAFMSFVYAIYAVVASVLLNQTIVGWTSLIFSVLFIGGIQLIFMGIIGEYIGKIFIEIKQRPIYLVKEIL
jgi:glycosyltransferase involved in cell wall biosynthesis